MFIEFIETAWKDTISMSFMITTISFLMIFLVLEIRLFINKKKTYNSRVEFIKSMQQKATSGDVTVSIEEQEKYELARQILLVEEGDENTIDLIVRNNKLLAVERFEQILPPFKESNFGFVPSFLTSLGILGTFIGISLGLSTLNLGSGADSNALIAGATGLLDGMKTAFSTSLIGLACGAIFMTVHSLFTKAKMSLFLAKKAELADYLYLVSPIEYLKGLDPEKQDKLANMQAQSMESLKSAGEQFGQVVNALSDFNPDVMGHKIGSNIRDVMQEEFKPLLSQMTDELHILAKIKAESGQEIIEKLTGSLRDEIIKPVAEQIQDVSLSVKESNQSISALTSQLGSVTESLGSSIETIKEFQVDTLKEMKEFSSDLHETLKTFQKETRGTLEMVGEQIAESLRDAQAGMQTQREAFISSANEAEKVMDSARINLEKGLGDIDEKVNNIKDALQRELEAFRVSYQENLTVFFGEQNNNLKGLLSEQEDGLLRVIDQYKDAYTSDLTQRNIFVEKTEKAVEKIVNSTETLNNLVQAVSIFNESQVVDLITQTQQNNEGVVALNKSYTEATDAFGQTIEKLESSLTNYFENTTDRTERFFKEVDDSTATIMRNLTAAASAIVVASNGGVSSNKENMPQVREIKNAS
ncbi:MotA/TolQ/ExbB proton channel family protein [Thalassotalea ponticola]|uniref:MotA/TolQ/ExbB proton channel family protein n=1 Tax=Thalassotalea ponticola TaxID=1523392 RepID=UPI0025B4F19B|nr:MotA/TolQ/ExbB proton channel family protein [Thalassotalea ponticola]MDN3652757.1 MotA/TolQ/ExbB proton channel family protein [Thalassotalea ponticola]